jgi:hypothetical protein
MVPIIRNDRGVQPPDYEIAGLLNANIGENVFESVMRLRALTEISSHLDTYTLIGLAHVSDRQKEAIVQFVTRFIAAPK